MALEEARAEVTKLKTEKYLLEMAQQQQAQQLQKTIAQMSPNQIKHNTIVARFKASATKKELDAHESYKTWTQQKKLLRRRLLPSLIRIRF